MPKGAETSVRVSTFETEFTMKIKSNATGKDLFDSIAATTGIREHWYFGLQFTDTNNKDSWLLKEKRINKQDVKKETPQKFQYKIKYFPENVTDEIIQDVTLRLLFKQVKNEILTEKVFCPADKAVLLASYAVQAKFGDFDDDSLEPGFLQNEKLLPQKILSQHKLSMSEWEDKIQQFHKQHKGLHREEAMIEYLKIAQDLEMYGITYFPVINAKGSEVLLGVDALGINMYEKSNKFAPKVSFPWSEIAKVSSKNNNFKIRFTDRSNPPNKIKGKEPKVAKKIFQLAAGNHEMYRRRRMPDPLEVQQMKSQRDQERQERERQRAALRREMSRRETLEKQQAEMDAKMKEMEEDMERRMRELEEARENIERLERLLAEAQASRDELERQQNELREMVEKMEHDREMEVEDKQRLEEEIRAKEQEIEEIRSRAQDTRKIQEDLEEARQDYMVREADLQRSAVNGSGGSSRSNSIGSSSAHDIGEDIPAIVVNPVEGEEDREPNQKTEDLLASIRDELISQQHTMSAEDEIYRDNLSQGRDKFRTLREVRTGNTKRRIDIFEGM